MARFTRLVDIFLSYDSSDREAARALADRLCDEGWSVWWDRKILPGQSFDAVIEKALSAARCVSVLWSKQSVMSDWVKSEAEEGKQREILVPALVEEAQVTLAFRRLQTANIAGWQTPGKATELDQFLEAIRATLQRSVPPDAPEGQPPQDLSSVRKKVAPGPSAGHRDLAKFMSQTHAAWCGGKLFAPPELKGVQMRELLQDLQAFTRGMLETVGVQLKAVLGVGEFMEDEFLVCAGFILPGIPETFVITSRMFYFFPQGVEGPVVPIRLKDVRNYKTSGLWTKRAEFTMNNGEIVAIKGCVPPENYVNAYKGDW
ncbi:MAG TPA: toll/interleukin-1 receptor domain-containing protein [Thermoanaerobaculia bacterium]|nr:toll/interleukin-1 receptor domain-containing protein [Thermoanaerobaculia bacterium]